MTWRGEVEDGMGWGGLVGSKAEQDARKAHRAEMLKHYASGLEDGRADQLAKFAALLPGPHYMDPPDGGDVSALEQMRRMSEDAARWRWFMAGLGDQGQKLAISVDMAIQDDKKAAE